MISLDTTYDYPLSCRLPIPMYDSELRCRFTRIKIGLCCIVSPAGYGWASVKTLESSHKYEIVALSLHKVRDPKIAKKNNQT
jgi:hypothetical protein